MVWSSSTYCRQAPEVTNPGTGSIGVVCSGVGASGMGKYHGEESIALFSHAKPVLDVPAKPDLLAAIYPPFTSIKETLVRRFIAPPRR